MLAADTLGCISDVRTSHAPKAWRIGRLLAAACGSRAESLQFRDWLRGGLNGPCPFEDKDDAGDGFVVMPNGRLIMFGRKGHHPIDMPFYTTGSGWEIALGAMAAGASAEHAVEIASRYDINTGGEITVLRLQRERRPYLVRPDKTIWLAA